MVNETFNVEFRKSVLDMSMLVYTTAAHEDPSAEEDTMSETYCKETM